MTTTRISAGAGTVDITHRNVTYTADADGVFTVPSDIANELINLRVAVIAPDVAPSAAPAPSNLFPASAFEAVTLDMDEASDRLLLSELESYARMFPRGSATFTDRAEVKHELSVEEISHLVYQIRSRQFAAA